jgi:cytochrome c peroxidase
MHDGSMKSLNEVIDHYVSGGKMNSNKDKRIEPINITENEKRDLIAFLESLTDSSFTTIH